MNTESKKTRIRRTNEQVDKAISDALTTLAGQMPLARITVNQLIAEAGIEAAVFFKRYSSIDDLIYEYVRDHDFWLGETVSYRKMDKEGAERYYIRTLEDLCRHLDSNGPLRDSLLWELASDSEAVKKIADIRELENESLLAYYRKYFKGTGLVLRPGSQHRKRQPETAAAPEPDRPHPVRRGRQELLRRQRPEFRTCPPHGSQGSRPRRHLRHPRPHSRRTCRPPARVSPGTTGKQQITSEEGSSILLWCRFPRRS